MEHDTIRLTPGRHVVGEVQVDRGNFYANERAIPNERSMYACDVATAREHGGALMQAFLDQVLEVCQAPGLVVDARVHRLPPASYPAIPGWHLDEVPRRGNAPDPTAIHRAGGPIHYLCIVGRLAMPEFIDEPVELPAAPAEGRTLYGTWDELVGDAVARSPVKSGTVVCFGLEDLHRATPAPHCGGLEWRWFARATALSKRRIENVLPSQVQVYLEAVGRGW